MENNYGAGENSKVLGIGYDGTPTGREWDLGSKNDPRGGPFSSNSTTGRKGSLAIVCDGIPKGRACDLGSKNAPQADLSDLNSTSGKKGGLAMGAFGSRLLGSFQDRVTSRTDTKEGFGFESESLVKKSYKSQRSRG